MAEKVEAYLNSKKNSIKQTEIAESVQILEKLYVKKLWNQITDETLKLVYDSNFVKVVDLKEFYDNFIREFELRINSLKLVQIIIPIAGHIFQKNGFDASMQFLQKFEKTVAKNPEASIRLKSAQIEVLLKNKDSNGAVLNIPLVRNKLDETQKNLDNISGITNIHASFYKLSALYLKEIGDHANYYREALRYLGCEDLSRLSADEKRVHATLLGFAALLGKDVYNFGELLAHPILKSLEGSSEEWLLQLLMAFNAGQVNKFYESESIWSKCADLVKNRQLLECKIRLLCLLEIAMGRPPKQRQIAFNEIAQRAKIEKTEVEFLVMKALSIGLIKGSIDQINETVNVSWIQPRVLSSEQIRSLADRINLWHGDVQKMESVVSENAKEILMRT